MQRHGLLKSSQLLVQQEYSLVLGDVNLPDSLFPTQSEGMFSQIQSTEYGFTNYTEGEFTFTRGHKQYELSNHLGNELVTIQDRKWGRQTTTQTPQQTNCDYYLSYVVTITDYHAFGSTITERSATFGGGYRFGFNNQEKESELGDYYTFEYRIHDARLGRFLSVDPLAAEYPWNSVYAFAENRVIDGIDLEGLEYMRADGKVTYNSRITNPTFSNGSLVLRGGTTISVPEGSLISYIDKQTGETICAYFRSKSGTFHHYGTWYPPDSKITEPSTKDASQIPVTNPITSDDLENKGKSGMDKLLAQSITSFQRGPEGWTHGVGDKYKYCWSMQENHDFAMIQLQFCVSSLVGGYTIASGLFSKTAGNMIGNTIGQVISNFDPNDFGNTIKDINLANVAVSAIPVNKFVSLKTAVLTTVGSLNITVESLESFEKFCDNFQNYKKFLGNSAANLVGNGMQSHFNNIEPHRFDFNLTPPTNFQSNLFDAKLNIMTNVVTAVPGRIIETNEKK